MNYSPTRFLLHHVLVFILLLPCCRNILTTAAKGGGRWDLLLSNVGISAMHMQLLNTDRVVIFDVTDYGPSNISLPDGKCINGDCTAHSVEYDVASNSIRPLTLTTSTFCSSGAVDPNGTLVQTGGHKTGDRSVRLYKPCKDSSCGWQEMNGTLARRRWYATDHILPDGRQIIIGGRRQFNYEFYPKIRGADGSYNLPLLSETNDPESENNLYPFVFLNVDGNLFIFANNRAILFDYTKRSVVKTYPQIPGGDPRSYPSSGSAVLLPLKNDGVAEVIVCGGAPIGAFPRAENGTFDGALNSCGRIRITDSNPQWIVETMPIARVMGDMLLLPNGEVLIINGSSSGTAGWEDARDPVLSPVLYRPNDPLGSRFEVQNSSSTPRMYHSSALLLRDGRVLVGGSNPHEKYTFAGATFPTDLSLESFSPSYLDSEFTKLRPKIIRPASSSRLGYNTSTDILFTTPPGRLNTTAITVAMVAPTYVTHSFSMNQRMLILVLDSVRPYARSTYKIRVVTPGSGNLAPSGYYLLFVCHQGIPSEGIWVQIK